MKKVALFFVLVSTILKANADEGMWLPLLLGQQVYNNMVKRGLKLKANQLYSVNQSSIKDAVIIFGAGCTGEIVSSQGLIFTNHHCGYSQIAAASSVEHNYLRDGFWAEDHSKEISSKNLTVKFLDRITDVTQRVLDSLAGLPGADRAARLARVQANMAKEVTGGDEFKSVVVASMFKGNQFFMYVYTVYKDVRLVGTPPESVGKFGGDTDNWEWPRHTGDFSVFRVYTAANGKPANYSADNVPMMPKHFLPVSLRGIKEGDYAMIFGYPGGTNRYETSYGVKLSTDINNPTLVRLRDMRLKYMMDEMKKSAANKLQLAAEYASIANYWKFFDGETKQLLKADVYSQKKMAEDKFIAWAKGKPQYENVFSDYAAAYDDWRPYAMLAQYIKEGVLATKIIAAANVLLKVETQLKASPVNDAELQKAITSADSAWKAFNKNTNRMADENILASTLMMFRNDIDKSQQPKYFYEELLSKYALQGNVSRIEDLDLNPYKMYASTVYSKSILADSVKWKAFKQSPSLSTLDSDPAYNIINVFVKDYNTNYLPKFTTFTNKNNDLGRLYLKGIMEMDPAAAKNMYPDANSTMRVSYGNVKSYHPKDATSYSYITTMKGVIEKYQPGDYEFDLPKKYLQLYKAKDFGRYADPVQHSVVVAFLSSNDITGGNSGSPVMNANGELIGLAFDGNYEALSHKMIFDNDLNRTINVDIRYVLWCIEKLGGAKHIVDELKLVN